jgi:hypothetical protein
VAAHHELRARAFRDAGLDIELTGPVEARPLKKSSVASM